MTTAYQLHQNGDCAGFCVVCDEQDNCEHSFVRNLRTRSGLPLVCERCRTPEPEPEETDE